MDAHDLAGWSVAFLVANDGVEEVELTHPWDAVTAAGARAVLIAPQRGHAQTYRHLDRAGRQAVDCSLAEVAAGDYDAVVLPGGVANPDILRRDRDAHRFLRDADAHGTTIAAIWTAQTTHLEANLITAQSDRDVAAFTDLLLARLQQSGPRQSDRATLRTNAPA